MNKRFKQSIKQSFQAPAPAGKQGFFLSLPTRSAPSRNLLPFLYLQAGYIRKRIWLGSLILFAAALWQLYLIGAPFQAVAVCSALLPLLSLLAMSEVNRSLAYRMAELEMSCKHSFSRVVLARLGILGCFHLLCFLTLLLLLAGHGGFTFWQLGLYLTTPMLAGTFCTMAILNRLHTRESILVCGAVCGSLSFLQLLMFSEYPMLLSQQYLMPWLAVFAALIPCLIAECKKLMKRTEDLSWNLSLTA